jgi:hypothetical protein
MGETGRMWSPEEIARLKSLRLSPIRNTPQKLQLSIEHFKNSNNVYETIDKGIGSDYVVFSKELARKVRDLVREGKLDWPLVGKAK